jgi:hypothetical protein
MQMSARIYDGDMFYMGWWFLLIGSVIFLLFKIELNTRVVAINEKKN